MIARHGSWIEVDLDAVESNLRLLRSRVPAGTRILVPVKADAYGHGSVGFARALLALGADRIGVARAHEAVTLREAGIDGTIHVLEPFHPDDLGEYLRHDLVPTICDVAAARVLARAGESRGRRVTAHLKVDTGMGRLGFHWERGRAGMAEVAALSGLDLEGVFTHFAKADLPGGFTEEQRSRFDEARAALAARGVSPRIVHAANSAALLQHPATHYDMVRPGVAVYGYNPLGDEAAYPGLRPSLRLYSTVRELHWHEPGETISYGGIWTAGRRTLVATLPLGYGDGFVRAQSNRAVVRIRGVLCRQIGRVCMDLLMIDVTDVPGVSQGDAVSVIDGEADARLSVEALARAQGTISYEVVCGLGRRLERVYVHGDTRSHEAEPGAGAVATG